MEIKLFLGKTSRKFIISKFIQNFIIPLDKMTALFSAPNNYEVMRSERQGKLFNFVVETDETTPSFVIPKKSGNYFFAKKPKAVGFSPFILFPEDKDIVRGVITIIAKHCDKEGFDGYYLNAFWGFPVEPEPFIRTLNPDDIDNSVAFWSDNAYRADMIDVDCDQILIPADSSTDTVLKAIEDHYKVRFSPIGLAEFSNNRQEINIVSEGKYMAYRRMF